MKTPQMLELYSKIDMTKVEAILIQLEQGEIKLDTIRQRKARMKTDTLPKFITYLELDIVLRLSRYAMKVQQES